MGAPTTLWRFLRVSWLGLTFLYIKQINEEANGRAKLTKRSRAGSVRVVYGAGGAGDVGDEARGRDDESRG